MEPVRDHTGAVRAWQHGDDIYSTAGEHLAKVVRGHVYATTGRHLGVLDRGFIRDHRGGAVAWFKGARGGPVKPVPTVAPLRPIRAVRRIMGVRQVPPVKAVPTLSWGLEWDEFIHQ